MSDVALTNVSFNYLKHSNEFLNLLVNNITSCVLLLDQNMELQAFNDAMKTIFSNKPNEHLLYKKCGEAIGCAYVIDEEKECGKTSQCKFCELRASALISYTEKKPIYKQQISREYYTSISNKELKHLQFSTRPFYYQKEYYIVVIIDNITKLVNQETLIENQRKEIEQLKHVY